MPRGLNNWTYNDVTRFLKEYNFKLNHTRGSHFYYVGVYEGRTRHVCVPYHGSGAIKPRTVKGIILQSGIPEKVWTKR